MHSEFFLNCIIKEASPSCINASSVLCQTESQKLYGNNYIQVCPFGKLVNNCLETSMNIWSFDDMNRIVIFENLDEIITCSLLFDTGI